MGCDAAFLEGLCTGDLATLGYLVHRDLVFTNETGCTYYTAQDVPYPARYRYRSIEVLQREVSIHLSVGLIDSSERRLVDIGGMLSDRLLRYNRIWRFDGRRWQLISVTATSIS